MASINKEKKVNALKWVQDVNRELDNLSNRVKEKLLDYYRVYRTFENQGTLPGQSNIFIPKVFEIIEKKTPAIVANNPTFIPSPRKNEANAYIGAIRDTLAFWWSEDKMKRKMEPAVKEAFIYGTTPWKVDWFQEIQDVEEEVEMEDEETGEVFTSTITEPTVVFERPTARNKSIFDIKVDPRVETFQEGIGLIDIIRDVRWSKLLEKEEEYDLSDLKDVDVESLMVNTPDRFEQEKMIDEGLNILTDEIDKNRILLYEYWGLFSPDGEPENEKEYIITCIVVDNEPKYVIRCEKNELGFRPFLKIDDRVVRGEFYPVGECEALEGLQIEYNNLRNGRLDYNNAVNYAEWMYNINAGINPSHLVHRPNNVIPVDLPIGSDISAVLRPVDKPFPPVSGINEEAQMNRDFQTISQTIDWTDRGGSVGFINTATGVRSRDSQIGIQAQTIVNHVEDFISELGWMWLALADKFSEDKIMIRRKRTEEDIEDEGAPSLSETPEKFTEISKEIIADAVHNLSVQVEGGSTTRFTAEGKAQDAINIANFSVQMQAVGVPVDMVRIFKEVLSDNFNKPNPEQYVLEKGTEAAMMPPEEEPGGNPPLQPSQPNQPLNPII